MQPGLDLVALGLQAPRVGEHQRRPPPVERGLEGRERAYLLGRRAGGQLAGEDLARFTPDQKVGHEVREEGRAERSTGTGPPALRRRRREARSSGRSSRRSGPAARSATGWKPQVTPATRTPAARATATSVAESPTIQVSPGPLALRP